MKQQKKIKKKKGSIRMKTFYHAIVKRGKRILKPIKHLWQRITRGFSDDDLWQLDYVFAKFILKRLEAFSQYPKQGRPIFDGEEDFKKFKKTLLDKEDDPLQISKLFYGDDWNIYDEYWKLILDKMQWSFKYVIDGYAVNTGYSYVLPIEEMIEFHKRNYEVFQEGMQLFAKYYCHLND
jgi:hypothetical protein